MPKIFLKSYDSSIKVDSERPLLEQLQEQGIYVKSSCGGHASCTDCKIKIESGEDFLTPPSHDEIRLLGNVFHMTKERLSCCTKVLEDGAVIDLSDQVYPFNFNNEKANTNAADQGRKVKTIKRKVGYGPAPSGGTNNRNKRPGAGKSKPGGGWKPKRKKF